MANRSRRGRDSSGRLDPFAQRRARYEVALRPLGLWELFAAMPREAQEGFAQHKFPDPVLEFDKAFPTDRPHRELRKRLDSAFRRASMCIDDADITVRDFFSVLTGLKSAVQGTIGRTDLPEACLRFMREAGPLLDYWYEQYFHDAWSPLHAAVIAPLAAHSRLDGRLLSGDLRTEPSASGKYVVRLSVRATEPQVRRVRLDGVDRPAYRVGAAHGWHGIDWLSWTAGHLGRAASDITYPVYAQSHALLNLRRRVNLPSTAPYVEAWLAESLREPVVVDRQGADLLVEYRIHEHRLGYLVVTPLDDAVVVRTFKFLTMERTPEARELERRLRLTRRDVDWLGLHELSAFTQTDLRDDDVLRPLLEACGCGHLFHLDRGDFAPEPKAFAAEVRRYLRLAA